MSSDVELSKFLRLSDQLYRILLRTYPTAFRREYGPLMAQLFQDNCRAEWVRRGSNGLLSLWLQTLFDWLKTVFDQHMQEVFHMSGQQWMVRLGALAALAGGSLGLYLLRQGPNAYGNYHWHGWLAPVVAFLFALGLGGAVAAHQRQLNSTGWLGGLIAIVGLLLMGLGYALEALWGFIFIGPLIIMPIGAFMLGISIYRHPSLPTWQRYFPLVVGAIAVLGFGIELLEEFSGNTSPDRGLQLAEALFSLVWIGLGIGLWLSHDNLLDDPQLVT